MNALEKIYKLEQKGVYIHYSPEMYDDGANVLFSIQFKNQDKQTMWYNDNHEFGDYASVIGKSIMMAEWYLAKPKRIEMIDVGINHSDYSSFVKERGEMVYSLYTEVYKNGYDNR